MEKIVENDSVNNEEVFIKKAKEESISRTIKANWFGHILRRNLLLKHVTERNVEGRGRSRRRYKQLLNNLQENRRYCKLKEAALSRL
jgi:hypothetical protein